jgi:TIR domain/Pentapeptide repeats (8 copies)
MSSRLDGANLLGANLSDALLGGASLLQTNLSEANLKNAYFYHTTFSDTNLNHAVGLETCRYSGPCTVDHRTLFEYEPLPISFLRGCGLPENLIDYLPSLRGTGVQFYSCFISYSTKDHTFAERLHADLQNRGVRCWFAPHDLTIGAKTWDAIDDAIQLRDKVLLVLSQAAIASDWVEDEVSKAYAEERERKTTVLFPIRIDDTVMMTTAEPWARKLRDQRNIGNFLKWNEAIEYQKSLEKLLRDLKSTTAQ